MEKQQNYHEMKAEEVISTLKTSTNGLSAKDAEERLEKNGPNELKEKKKISPWKIFIRQFTSFMVMILIFAIIVSAAIGEFLDAIVISVIVILNGIFGFIQEFKAEKAIEALRKLTALKARVIRDGEVHEIDSRDLVPGDLILLTTGSKIPADARLIEAVALQADESSLTGESVPTRKEIDSLEGDIPITDRKNMVYMGTTVTKGRGKAVIASTGMNTEVGKIAEMVQEADEKTTPLQYKLKHFSKWLGFMTIGICVIVFLIGVSREYFLEGILNPEHVTEFFLVAVALAVAAIPEGLPAIVTISLALGVRRMVKRNALIRKLSSVETLGSTNIICSDKTGTLTRNEMTVKEIYANDRLYDITGDGYSPKGDFMQDSQKVSNLKDLEMMLRIGVLCNDSKIENEENRWKVIGDPTEAALVVSAAKAGIAKEEYEDKYPRTDELPFDSIKKSMATIHKAKKGKEAYVKGAPDMILNRCRYISIDGRVRKLTAKDKEKILKINHEMANKALRVLGFAYKSLKKGYETKNIEKDMIFVGLQAMMDPPREEVKDSIAKCRSAGIRTVIITGDHKMTAIAVAKKLGLFGEDNIALSGDELDDLSDKELAETLDRLTICARVSPEHKVRILDAFKNTGHVVAMTGDGVNDAPALKRSDIGVAMGITGTDVAKESSDIILTDDNFASIVNAVEEGRGIYNSIKQFIQYTLSSNFGEILVIFIAILIGWPLPLVAIQILWVNLLTDGLPGLALGLDSFDRDIMKKKPRKKTEKIISSEILQNIFIVGIVMAAGTLLMFNFYGIFTEKARSIAFTTLILFQLFNVMTFKSKHFRFDLRVNKFLIGSILISVLLQFIVIYTPLNKAFGTVPLTPADWLLIVAVSSTLYFILEIRKMLIDYFSSKSSKQE